MSIARLTDSIRRAGEGIDGPRRILLADLSKDYDAPPPSTIRRIIRDWADEGVDLAGFRVRAEKFEGRLFLVIDPRPVEEIASARRAAAMSVPLYHQFGRVVSVA